MCEAVWGSVCVCVWVVLSKHPKGEGHAAGQAAAQEFLIGQPLTEIHLLHSPLAW